jgi:hypothetical protein
LTKVSGLNWGTSTALAAVLLVLGALLCIMPLRTAVQIGADEGFELAKATLQLKGYKLYSDIWWDHPPLHPFLLAQVVKNVSPSVLGPRLVSAGFAALLLASVFLLALRLTPAAPSDQGTVSSARLPERAAPLLTATVAAVLLIGSPGFIELSSSCMMEIPALAPVVAALALLWTGRRAVDHTRIVVAGALFGVGLSMKLIGIINLPLVVLIHCLRQNGDSRNQIHSAPRWSLLPLRAVAISLLAFGVSAAVTFLAIVLLIDGGAFLRHFQQTWTAHFAHAATSGYGSADLHRFPPILLLKNWDLTLPAVVGVIALLRKIRHNRLAALPVAWLGLMLTVFAAHKPWWSYYYIHIAVPLSWCAACGITAVAAGIVRGWRSRRLLTAKARIGRSSTFRYALIMILACAYVLCAVAWMSARVYLQIAGVREAPRTFHALVLNEMTRYKPFTQWMYSDNLAYSFHSGIPVPPTLAILSYKRFWSGDMTHERVDAEMRQYAPGLIALRNDSREVPFQGLLETEYRLVYYDTENRLYAHRTIANKPDL